jgi:hypothetical protein
MLSGADDIDVVVVGASARPVGGALRASSPTSSRWCQTCDAPRAVVAPGRSERL